MEEQEDDECEGDPEPGYFDEEHVEEILLFCEVARRLGWRMRLGDGVVGRVSSCGVDGSEDGAEEEGCRVDG